MKEYIKIYNNNSYLDDRYIVGKYFLENYNDKIIFDLLQKLPKYNGRFFYIQDEKEIIDAINKRLYQIEFNKNLYEEMNTLSFVTGIAKGKE